MESLSLVAFAVRLTVIVAALLLRFAGAALPLADLMDLFGADAGGSPLNVGTVTAFLTWFGGIGYLLTARTGLGLLATLGLATVGGAAGAGVVFVAVVRYLLRGQTAYLDVGDYRMQGTLARVTLPLGGERIGEIVYEQGGATRSEGARSADGSAVPRGREVVVLRYEKGIAYVEPLDQLLAERELRHAPLSEGK